MKVYVYRKQGKKREREAIIENAYTVHETKTQYVICCRGENHKFKRNEFMVSIFGY